MLMYVISFSPHGNCMIGPYVRGIVGGHLKIDPNPKGSAYLNKNTLEMDPGMQPEERHVICNLPVPHWEPRRVHLKSQSYQ